MLEQLVVPSPFAPLGSSAICKRIPSASFLLLLVASKRCRQQIDVKVCEFCPISLPVLFLRNRPSLDTDKINHVRGTIRSLKLCCMYILLNLQKKGTICTASYAINTSSSKRVRRPRSRNRSTYSRRKSASLKPCRTPNLSVQPT